ncbi:hypothetical protein EV646_102642 [Kribbella antiqua]|uniref:Zinc ribbon protein n=1 Tax=Kribbella antiqua TaxID=2512217 RepID=A0A4R2J1H9_9ACTN|nr:zinc ribbon domain-containing protein [Kribbella antiqua]TCO50568.1 hypothetical protein EV646_102642 [Kribbella antiqua]
MILCNDCGEQNEDNTAFCTRCGVFLEWEGEKVSPAEQATVVVKPPAEAVPAAVSAARPPLPAPEQLEARQPQTVKRRMPRRSKSPVIVPTGSRICGGCGMPNEGTRRFCAKCGFSLADAKVIRKTAWWRRLLGRERIYAAGTRIRPGNARRRFRGATRVGVVLALLAGGGVLAGPQRGLVERGIDKAKDALAGPEQVRLVDPKASGVAGKQVAALAFDGAKNTFWGAPRTGRGAKPVPFVAGSFGKPVKLVEVGIWPGVSDQTPKFVAAPRPAEIEITVFTGAAPVVRRFPVEDVPKFQKFKLPVDDARSIQIAVTRTTNPTRSTLTAIAELEFFTHH